MKYLLLTLQYLPHVLAAVIAVQQSMAGAPGADKKQAVMSAILAASQVGEKVPEDHVKVISTLIDVLVGTLNATGWFAPKAATAADPVK